MTNPTRKGCEKEGQNDIVEWAETFKGDEDFLERKTNCFLELEAKHPIDGGVRQYCRPVEADDHHLVGKPRLEAAGKRPGRDESLRSLLQFDAPAIQRSSGGVVQLPHRFKQVEDCVRFFLFGGNKLVFGSRHLEGG